MAQEISSQRVLLLRPMEPRQVDALPLAVATMDGSGEAMSMLGEQIKELREAARNIQGKLGRCLYRRKDVDEMQQVSSMLFEAANTITSLRDRLQELQGVGGESRYSELFGTPERVARTFEKLIEDSPFLVEESRDSFRPASICDFLNELCNGCGKCPSLTAVRETEHSIEFECNGGDYDALLEWMKGESDEL